MSGTLSQWGKAFSDFSNLEQREVTNRPWWKKTFKGSDEETALEIFAQKKNGADASRDQGPYLLELWTECLERSVANEKQMRRKRKQELYKKQEQIDAVINFAIGFIIFVISGGILFCIFYFLGKWQGRW